MSWIFRKYTIKYSGVKEYSATYSQCRKKDCVGTYVEKERRRKKKSKCNKMLIFKNTG